MEIKRGSGLVHAVAPETQTYKGIKVGVVEGYIATWDLDRGNDVFLKGAFSDSIKEWQNQQRDIKAKDMHGESIGVYPVEYLQEDEKGLFGRAYINLEIQAGQEAMSKARMGIYDRKSIGFTADPNYTKGEFPFGREIGKAHIWEGSLVDEPMNINATITSVKASCNDVEKQLGLSDPIYGGLILTPNALYKASIKLACNRLNLDEQALYDAKQRLSAYYRRCDVEEPKDNMVLGKLLGKNEDIKALSIREIENIFKDAGCTEKQSKGLISAIKGNFECDQIAEVTDAVDETIEPEAVFSQEVIDVKDASNVNETATKADVSDSERILILEMLKL